MYAYCATNDILIHAGSIKAAREFAEYRLSPKYGFLPGRADNLKLQRISKAKAQALLCGFSIFWEA